MLKICLVSWKSEPQYAYKHFAYKKHAMHIEYSLVTNKRGVQLIGWVGNFPKI